MPDTTISTSLLESVNIVLANLGEAPVNSLSGNVLPQQVSLALNTLEEVSTDIQSKGWWFNQQSGGSYDETANILIYPSDSSGSWSANIPEEARRYITIRASRIAQTRLIGSEELQKFSFNEELVSLAILQQAHVRNSNGVLDFNSFPSELRSLGIDEVMFLQGNVEEKLGILRLGGELANVAKTKAETSLAAEQERLVEKQVTTEEKSAEKVEAEKALIDAQELKTDAERLLVDKQALDVEADTTLKGKQGALVDAQELKTDAERLLVDKQALDVAADTVLKGKQGSLLDAQATDVAADTTLKGKQGALVDAQELKTDAEAALIASQTTTDATQRTLIAAQELKTDAETTLTGKQGSLVDAQAIDVAADTTLKGKQGALIDAQELKTDAETTLTSNQSDLIASQKTELDAKTAIDVAAEKAFYDGVVAGTQDTYRDYAAEMRMMGIQESTFQQTPAYKKVELLKDAVKLRTATATETNQNSDEIEQVNKVLRFIGEPPVSTLGDNALASETARLLRDTDSELQGRGWWFNTRKNEEFEPDGGIISLLDNVLSIEVDGIPTHISRYGAGYRLFNRDTNSTTSWNSTIKATVIYKKGLNDVPKKYLEYLNVRTAILLTELYPQSGVDIQRLPKMEQELRAYFKDRQNDEANYTVFDNYDAASIIGINRNHSII